MASSCLPPCLAGALILNCRRRPRLAFASLLVIGSGCASGLWALCACCPPAPPRPADGPRTGPSVRLFTPTFWSVRPSAVPPAGPSGPSATTLGVRGRTTDRPWPVFDPTWASVSSRDTRICHNQSSPTAGLSVISHPPERDSLSPGSYTLLHGGDSLLLLLAAHPAANLAPRQ